MFVLPGIKFIFFFPLCDLSSCLVLSQWHKKTARGSHLFFYILDILLIKYIFGLLILLLDNLNNNNKFCHNNLIALIHCLKSSLSRELL